jgi:hypothetical protein
MVEKNRADDLLAAYQSGKMISTLLTLEEAKTVLELRLAVLETLQGAEGEASEKLELRIYELGVNLKRTIIDTVKNKNEPVARKRKAKS